MQTAIVGGDVTAMRAREAFLQYPQNMQWQSRAAAKAKDRTELNCATCKARRPP